MEDHCIAIDLILKKGKIGETYVIGGMTEEVSNLDIVKKIIKLMDRSEDMIEHVDDRLGHDRRYGVDWSKINKDLGWKPSKSFEDNIAFTVNWYKENETWWRRILSGEYKK